MRDELDNRLKLDMKVLAPREVDVQGVWEGIQQQTNGALRWRRARVGAVLLATLGLGLFGADRLVEALRPESYVVITGPSLPGDHKTSSAGPPATSISGSGSATVTAQPPDSIEGAEAPRVPTARASQLADEAVKAFPGEGLIVDSAVEMQYPDTTVTEIWMHSAAAGAGTISIYIFKMPASEPDAVTKSTAPAGTPHLNDLSLEEVAVDGALAASIATRADGSGSQMLAQLADRTVINVSSGILKPEKTGRPPIDKAGVEKLVRLLAQLVSQGQ